MCRSKLTGVFCDSTTLLVVEFLALDLSHNLDDHGAYDGAS